MGFVGLLRRPTEVGKRGAREGAVARRKYHGSRLASHRDQKPEIIAFARQFDPQVMHTDPVAAANGATGGLIASGWHTIGLMMRMYADHFLPENGLPAPGVDEVRWLRPVRPGDTLRMRVTIEEARVSRSKPDRGIIRPFSEVLNQHDEVVLTMRPINLVRRRP